MTETVKLVEIGPRDGLQNEAKTLSVAERADLIQKLVGAGFKFLEGGSFVSPKAIPQMQDSEKVWEAIKEQPVDISFLVPNQKGLDRALEAGVKSIAVFTATSDTFNQKNIRMSVEESLKIQGDVAKAATEKGLRVRGYISTVFGCPYEGKQDPKRALELAQKLFEMGCDEVSVGDTIGVAHPRQIKEVFGLLKTELGLDKLAGHFHDTRGMALLNIATLLDLGGRIFDSSIGGLGGCPYAKGASGNVASEEVVWFLEGQGLNTGVDLQMLLEVAAWVEKVVGRSLAAKLYRSNPEKLFYDV